MDIITVYAPFEGQGGILEQKVCWTTRFKTPIKHILGVITLFVGHHVHV